MGKYSTLAVIRELYVNNTKQYQYIPMKWLKRPKKKKNYEVGEYMDQLKLKNITGEILPHWKTISAKTFGINFNTSQFQKYSY